MPILALGSSKLCVHLLEAQLVDEIRLMVNPVLLGSGHPLFAGLHMPLHLNLRSSRVFDSGNVLLSYEPRY
jgi:dihydrofolate reductase